MDTAVLSDRTFRALVFQVRGGLLGECDFPSGVPHEEREDIARELVGAGAGVNVYVVGKAVYEEQQAKAERKIADPAKRRACAYHEAGHAVMAFPWFSLKSVRIRPRIMWSGGGFDPWHDSGGECVIDHEADLYRDREAAEVMMIHTIAGPMSAARATSRKNWRKPPLKMFVGTDRKCLDTLARLHSRSGADSQAIKAYVAYLTARTAFLLDHRWDEVVAVADALAVRLEMDGGEVESIIKATGQKT